MELRVVAEMSARSGVTVVAGVMEGLVPLSGSETVWETVDRRLLEADGFEGKVGEAIRLSHSEADSLILVGLGSEVSFRSLRAASGNAIRKARTETVVSLLSRAEVGGATRSVAEGSILGNYQYTAYKTDSDGTKVRVVELVDGDETELAVAEAVANATILARDWVNTPARDKSPADLAERIAAEADAVGMATEIWDRRRIEEEQLGALLGVAAGSERDPRVLVLHHRPENANRHLCLVGKGITFDSGGLSIKPAKSMEDMKDDMAGAAAVCAAAIGMAREGLSLDVTVIAPMTDNSIGGDATRPGDVLRPVAGPTIEVLNTDAEGRLILADGLGLASRYEPDLTIDVATLTGAAAVALGKEIAAAFASDDETGALLAEAAEAAGEEFWPMPLHAGYRKSIDSNIADIKNVASGRYGGAIVAALFLAEYAGDGPWAHLDIAGPARALETAGETVKGATGMGVRTLIEVGRRLADSR